MREQLRFAGRRVVLLAVLAVLGSTGLARDFAVGAGYAPGSAVSAHASWSFLHWQSGSDFYRLSARLDASYLPRANAAPSFGVAAVLGVRASDSPELYFGAGAGLTSASPPLFGPWLAGYTFGGVSFRLYEALHGTVEYQVAVSRVAVGHGVRLGLSWQFGIAP